VVPELIEHVDARRILVLGDAADLKQESWAQDARVAIRDYGAAVFGVREQIDVIGGLYAGIDMLWSPQYSTPLLFRGKLVVTIHDLCQLAYPETLANGLQRMYARTLLNHVAKKSSAIVCVSEFTAGEVRKYLNVEDSRLFVSYPGVDRYWMEPYENTAEGSGESDPYMLAVGNVKVHKNFKSLIQAFSLLRKRIPHRLVIVGQAHGFRNSDSEVASMLLADDERVHFTGKISDEDLRRYYGKADGLIFPSYYEGFGYPLVEAMAQQCPVACSRAASLPEVADGAALLFDPFDVGDIARAIERLATETELRKMLTARGLKRVEELVNRSPGVDLARVINQVVSS
jgi:glycosyltransferase involved in cell wall biosynthesis